MSTNKRSPAEGEFVAVDYGLKRVGVARINSHARIAEYLPTVQRTSDEQVVDELVEIVRSLSAHGIVVGLPRSLSGQETEQTAITRSFINKIRDEIGDEFELYMIDEAGTTEAAKERAGEISAGIDSVAAGIIAEDFINQPDVVRYKVV